ncbi:MAG: hypothetical protein HXY21_03735 [Parvularculaceae bacterium]|nr:hypothetical protein [Parvularculaceae bacterium]
MDQTSVRPGSIAIPAVAAAMLYARPSAARAHTSLAGATKSAQQGPKAASTIGIGGSRASAAKPAPNADVNRR